MKFINSHYLGNNFNEKVLSWERIGACQASCYVTLKQGTPHPTSSCAPSSSSSSSSQWLDHPFSQHWVVITIFLLRQYHRHHSHRHCQFYHHHRTQGRQGKICWINLSFYGKAGNITPDFLSLSPTCRHFQHHSDRSHHGCQLIIILIVNHKMEMTLVLGYSQAWNATPNFLLKFKSRHQGGKIYFKFCTYLMKYYLFIAIFLLASKTACHL